jgi:hypothetical protein
VYRNAHNAYRHFAIEKNRVERPEGPRIATAARLQWGAMAGGPAGGARPPAPGRGPMPRRLPRRLAGCRYRPLGAPPGAPLREAAGSPAKGADSGLRSGSSQEVEQEEEEAEVVKPGDKRKVCSAAAAASLRGPHAPKSLGACARARR